MAEFVDVPSHFASVYLVDFSPSLCEVAKKRFERLGWKNVRVVCEDARKFRLEDHESGMASNSALARSPALSYFSKPRPDYGGADLITMSYSLSMIVGAIINSEMRRNLVRIGYENANLLSTISPITIQLSIQ
jgi:betaine lipid synthase